MSTETHGGGCQCGTVRYEVDLELGPVIACNCSRCRRVGSLFTFVPQEAFRLLSGEGQMTEYTFNKNVIHHLFCSTCGIESFARGVGPDGSAMVAINARTLDGIDVEKLEIKHVDGASF